MKVQFKEAPIQTPAFDPKEKRIFAILASITNAKNPDHMRELAKIGIHIMRNK